MTGVEAPGEAGEVGRRGGDRLPRVGFLGAGFIATFHSKLLAGSGAAVARAGVFDSDRARAERFGANSGHTVCDSEDEVFDGCDAVYVCTWTSEHRRLVESAAARGLAIFCEKPLATGLADAEAMAAVVASAGVVNQVGLVLRFSPAFTLARALVTDDAAGDLVHVVFRDDQYIPIQGMYESSWRGDVRRAGAGTLLEHSIHDIDVVEWLAGPLSTVSARTRSFHGLAGIDDSVAVQLEFESGAIGSLASVWHDVLARPSLRRLELFAERRHVVVEGDWFGPVVATTGGDEPVSWEGGAVVAELERRGIALADPGRAFVDAVRAGRAAFPDFEVAVRAHRVVDAAYRSAAAAGRPIAV